MKNELAIIIVFSLLLGLVVYVQPSPKEKIIEKPVVVKEVEVKEVPTPVIVEKEKVVEKVVEKPVIVKEVQIEKVPVIVKEIQIEKVPVPVVIEKEKVIERIVERPVRQTVIPRPDPPPPTARHCPGAYRWYPVRPPALVWVGPPCGAYPPPPRYPVRGTGAHPSFYRTELF
jgi:hypothetical protein